MTALNGRACITITSERKGRKQYVPCFAAAAVNSGEQDSSNQMYDLRIFHSEIIASMQL